MRWAQRRNNGFTIVEMLVVVAIIATLLGLLLPAVQAARESGRRTACSSNQTQLALATNGYEKAKSFIPGWRNNNPAGTAATPSWPIPILPHLERNDIYQSWAAGSTPSVFLGTFVCSSALAGLGSGALSYAGNAGSLSNGRKWDGVMLDTTFSETGRIDMADISQGDGTATTILFSEKSQTGVTPQNWAAPHAAIASAPASLPVAFASLPVIGITQTPSESSLSNKPSSNHTSGSVVAFCDGHVIFLREDIAPWVYAQLISSKNSKAVYAITEWNPTGQILSGSDY